MNDKFRHRLHDFYDPMLAPNRACGFVQMLAIIATYLLGGVDTAMSISTEPRSIMTWIIAAAYAAFLCGIVNYFQVEMERFR